MRLQLGFVSNIHEKTPEIDCNFPEPHAEGDCSKVDRDHDCVHRDCREFTIPDAEFTHASTAIAHSIDVDIDRHGRDDFATKEQ